MTKQHKTQTKFTHPTKWNLKLLYNSPTDPQIEKDLENYNKKRAEFAKKYLNRTDYLRSEQLLFSALTEYEQLLNELSGAKPLVYLSYFTTINSNNTQAHAQLNKITAQLTKSFNQLTFFPIQLGKIDKALQTKFLSSKQLSRFKYFLERRFERAKHDLSEEQEKTLNLVDQPGHQMWVEGVEKTLNQLTVSWKGKQLPISQASLLIKKLPTKQRRELHNKVLKKISTIKEFAESEINAIVTNKNIQDELRGYSQPFSSRILSAQNNPETVKLLIETVTQNFNLAHRFYQLKAKILKLPELMYADRNAEIGRIDKQYLFQNSNKILANTFAQLHPDFHQILTKMVEAGQIDIFPRKNKAGGAFCSSSTNNPTFVLLNHVNDLDSVLTFAHEMGHAIHSQLSKKQPVFYQNYSTSIAETASTFFAQFVADKLTKKLSKKEQLIALHDQLEDDINTIFRQVALFNFELELHEQIKEIGFLDYEQIGELLNKHMSSYLGPAVKLTKLDGRFFIFWPHIRMFFYTYTYAFGHLISKAMIKNVKDNPAKIKQLHQLLSAGGNNKPENILLEAGIDINQPDFFKKGIDEIKEKLDLLENNLGKF